MTNKTQKKQKPRKTESQYEKLLLSWTHLWISHVYVNEKRRQFQRVTVTILQRHAAIACEHRLMDSQGMDGQEKDSHGTDGHGMDSQSMNSQSSTSS